MCACQQRVGAVIVPLRGLEVLAVLEPRCQSPRPPSISHNMTFMLDLSFTRIVTQTVEKRTERSAKRDRERPDLQLHLARAAVCCVWRRIQRICQLGVKDLVVSPSLNGSVLMHLEYISPDQNLAAYGSTYTIGSRATRLEFPRLNG